MSPSPRADANAPVRVLASYSHDSELHRAAVLTLCQRLRDCGIDAWVDQFEEVPPPPSWPQWMYEQIERAEFVLAVCTPTYRRRVEGREEPGRGRGARWEGAILTQHVYEHSGREPLKAVPVVLGGTEEESIPYFLRGTTYYRVDVDAPGTYRALLERLLGRPRAVPAPLGRPPADLASLDVQPKRTGDAEPSPLAFPETALLDLLGQDSLEPERLLDRWSAQPRASAPVVVGLGQHGAVTWDLVTEGPHAVIAGTTGSGKSELLRTMLTSIALTYSPSAWNFVLVDYKGGAALSPLERLPHTLGLISDIDSQQAKRLGKALNAEMDRRMATLRDSHASSYDALLASGGARQPMPRLLIVVDEFAALAEEVPTFMDVLASVARLGRSLGIHMVLATQRPGGAITDSIRATTAAWFALRTVDAGDSSEVLGSGVAASLPRDPGLTYMSVHGSEPVLFRVAYSESEGGGALEEVVRAAIATADSSPSHARASGSWVSGLPDQFLLVPRWQHDKSARGSALGLLDLPDQAELVDWRLRSGRLGSLKVVGTSGSGKTTTLLTIAGTSAVAIPSHDVEIAAISGRARSLLALASLPQTFSVVESSSKNAALRLLQLVHGEILRRTFRSGRDNAVLGPDTRSILADGRPLLLLVDDAHLLMDHVPESVPLLRELLQSPASLGIDVVVSVDLAGALRWLDGVDVPSLCLRLSDEADYSAAGFPDDVIPSKSPPGRGMISSGAVAVQLGYLGDVSPTKTQTSLFPEKVRKWADEAKADASKGLERMRDLFIGLSPNSVAVLDVLLPDCEIVVDSTGLTVRSRRPLGPHEREVLSEFVQGRDVRVWLDEGRRD